MKKNKRKKEEIAEDYCFICKDGGLLLVCEYKHCLKAYHPQCVGKDSTFVESGARWTCSWHACFICRKSPKFHCFCCPNAVCQRCISAAAFVHVRGKKGFCNDCLKLALLIEENVDVDSDGGKVDFKDRETYEFLFKEYWALIKEEEGLTLENLHYADALLKKGENDKSISDLDRFGKGEEEDQLFSDMDNRVEDGLLSLMEESKGQQCVSMKTRSIKSKKKEFIGWGSKPLVEFLASIGKDTSKHISQYDVTDIVHEYVHENKLLHPVKKKKVLCDAKLQFVLGRKSVNKNKIYDLLEAHFAENQEQSEEDEYRYISEDKGGNGLMACKKQRKSTSDRSHQKEKGFEAPRSCFASVIAKNIKLVYLKRSLVEDFLKHPETFEDKVIGSFVRVKSDPNDFFQRNSHQILQVTGVKKASGTGDAGTEILLQFSHLNKDIRICMLSDDEFSEEECEDLHQRVKDGVLKRPTVVELEQKVRSLHEDITKHWIVRELALLQNLIDRANEKGWRRELGEYLERRQLLQTSSEQLRLLQEVPKVIADEIELETCPRDSPEDEKLGKDCLLRSVLIGAPEIPSGDLPMSGTESHLTFVRTDTAGVGDSINENAASEIIISDSAGNGEESDVINESTAKKEAEGIGAAFMISRENEIEEKQNRSGVSVPEEHSESSVAKEVHLQSETFVREYQTNAFVRGELHQSSAYFTDEQKNQPVEVEEKSSREIHIVNLDENEGVQGATDRQRVSEFQLIELSDDDEEPNVTGNQTLEDSESLIWHYVDPQGDKQGPFSMSSLKCWSDYNYFVPEFKVWKTGQTQEEAILLTDVLCRMFPKK